MDLQSHRFLSVARPQFLSRTHTIYFKIWDPDTPALSLYVEEINQNGFRRGSDPEHFFHKLTGDEHQAHQILLEITLRPSHATWRHSISANLDISRDGSDSYYHPGGSPTTGHTTVWTSRCHPTDVFGIFGFCSILDRSRHRCDNQHALGTTSTIGRYPS